MQLVDLADFPETGPDIKTLAVLCPIQKTRGPRILVLIEPCHQLSRNLRHILQDQLTIVGGPLRGIGEGWLQRGQHNHQHA